nr:MAG TPA: hypothetical protein [Caudoviricetes sp.]
MDGLSADDCLDVRYAVAVAEALLKAYGLFGSQFAGPRHVDVDEEFGSGLVVDVHALFLRHAHFSRGFVQIVAEELRLERELFETGKSFRTTASNELVFVANKEEVHVACFVRAFVGEADGKRIGIELRAPTVDHLVFADPKSSLADLIRAATYLVRLGCENVGGFGDVSGFLVQAVRRLRQLVRMARLQDGHESKNETGEAESRADDGARLFDAHNSDSIHEMKMPPIGAAANVK